MESILDGIIQMRTVFFKNDLNPPSAILIESHEEGMRFQYAVMQATHWINGIDTTEFTREDCYMMTGMKILGIKFLWPSI